jgi:predicted Zn-dependent protease
MVGHQMNAHRRKRTLNRRALVWCLVAAGVAAVGMYFLHAYQVRRIANAFWHAADDAEAHGDLVKTADVLGRYVSLRPDDIGGCARYALLRERQARTAIDRYQAFLLLKDVLQRDPEGERPAVRLRAADVALSINRVDEAHADIKPLLQSRPTDPEVQELLGRCEEGNKRFARARAVYERVLEQVPTRVSTAYCLARLLRGPLNPEPGPGAAASADNVMNDVVEAAPDSVEARLVRYRYFQAAGNLKAAEKDLDYLRDKLAPDNAEVLLSSARLAEAQHHDDSARKYLRHGHECFPDDVNFSMALARLELRSGSADRSAAIGYLREALRAAQDDARSLWLVADLFVDAREYGEARKVVDRLATADLPPVAEQFLKARLLFADGKTGAAIDLMERCSVSDASRYGLAFLNRKTNLLLGDWYEEMDSPDQRLAAYERVLAEDPHATMAWAGKAMALAKLGHIQDALDILRKSIDEVPSLRLNVARLILARDSRLPTDQRQLTEAEAMLMTAPPEVKETVEYRLVLVDLYAASNRWREAEAEAKKACVLNPGEPRYWLALAALYESGPQPDAARQRATLEEAANHPGNVPELCLARAAEAVKKPASEARPLLLRLEHGLEKSPPAERGRTLAGLAMSFYRIGDKDKARQLLSQAVALAPTDLRLRHLLFEIASNVADDIGTANLAADLRQVEGEEGVLWRYEEATKKLKAAPNGDRAALAAARQQLAEIARRRPNWSRRFILEAELAELEGRMDLAVENYLTAIDRGERSQSVVRRAVQSLISCRRNDEARDLLKKMIEQTPQAASELKRMLVDASLPDVDSKRRALDMARAAVSPESADYRDFLWLGELLSSLGEKKEAETVLRKAVALCPTAPEPCVALVVLLAEAGRKDEARAERDRAEHVLPETLRPAVLGPCHEAVGDLRAAESAYLGMVNSHPEDPGAKRVTIAFYMRHGNPAAAEPILRSLASGNGPDACWARRSLALSLAATGDYGKTRQALALLDTNLKSAGTIPDDQRARALVLAFRPGDRRASIEALEQSFLQVKPTPAETFLLAQLYEADRNWSKASELFEALVQSSGGATPDVMAWYTKALLRHNLASDAGLWLDKLQRAEPDSERTVELRARLLVAENKNEEAGRVLVDFARKDVAAKNDPSVAFRVAALLTELGRPAEAETLYRFVVTQTEKSHPECALLFASFLSTQNRLNEALDLCTRAFSKCPVETVASVAIRCLRSCEGTDSDRQRVHELLESAVRQKPDSVGLLIARAEFLDASRDYEGAERVYRDLLARDPNNAVAMNNLAWLLAERDQKGAEALTLIERALQLAGPGADFLDTQASILLVLDRPRDAIKTLENAIEQMPTGSRYFHLSRVFELTGRRDAARDAWLRATKEFSLSERGLHPLERPYFAKLQAKMTSD